MNITHLKPKTIWVSVVTIGYLILALLGISTSSISALDRATGEASSNFGFVIGSPQLIRSDEYLRSTPQFIGKHTYGETQTILNFVDEAKTSNGISLHKFVGLLNIDSTKDSLLRVFPLSIAFAFDWWFYSFLTFLFLPLLLRKLSVPLSFGIPTAMLLYFSPTNQWWSNGPIQIIGVASVGFYFLLKASEIFTQNLKKISLGYMAISAIFLAQLPFEYIPWAIPISMFFFTLLFVPNRDFATNNSNFWRGVTYTFLSALLLFIIRLLIEFPTLRALSNTVYPGQRRIEAGELPFPIFSTTTSLDLNQLSAVLKLGNSSEVSIAFVELILVLSVMLPFLIFARKKHLLALNLMPPLVLLMIFLLWCTASWPNWLNEFNPLILVPTIRMAQVIGLLAIIAFAIMLFALNEISKKTKNYLVFSFAGLFAIFLAANKNQDKVKSIFDLTWIDSGSLNIISITLFFLIALAMLLPRVAKFSLLVLAGLTLVLTIQVNPIQQNLGSIHDSKLAQSIRELEDSDSGPWASNNTQLDAILLANTRSTLSGQQLTGPNIAKWEILDPAGLFEPVWNRGASFVAFNWTNSSDVVIENPANDVILISTSPCSSKVADLDLKWVLSTTELTDSCLNKVSVYPVLTSGNIYLYRTNTE